MSLFGKSPRPSRSARFESHYSATSHILLDGQEDIKENMVTEQRYVVASSASHVHLRETLYVYTCTFGLDALPRQSRDDSGHYTPLGRLLIAESRSRQHCRDALRVTKLAL